MQVAAPMNAVSEAELVECAVELVHLETLYQEQFAVVDSAEVLCWKETEQKTVDSAQ